jgi:hypothetical protein
LPGDTVHLCRRFRIGRQLGLVGLGAVADVASPAGWGALPFGADRCSVSCPSR